MEDEKLPNDSQQATSAVVRVEFFPSRPGEEPRNVSLRPGQTLGELLDHLELPPNAEAVLVNGRYEKPQYQLCPEDRIMIIRSLPGGG